MNRRRIAIVGALVALVVLVGFAGLAFGRPGGGESYSGGGGHSSGGGGGGGSYSGGGSSSSGDGDIGALIELLYWVIRLTIEYPQIMLPVMAIIAGFVVYEKYKQHQNKDWNSGPPVQLQRAVTLESIRQDDPDFSQVVFEDFVNRLFATAHRSRHDHDAIAKAVGPYLTEHARSSLVGREQGVVVESVVVGAMRVVRANLPDRVGLPTTFRPRVHVYVEFEANVTTKQATHFVVEEWMFARDLDVKSKPPAASRTFRCPNCGAPWQPASMGAQKCASCEQIVDNGRFDWVVEDITLRSTQERPPTLTNEVPERGTDLPTYRQAGVDAAWIALQRSDGALTDEGFQARLGLVYNQLNTGWSQNRLEIARGLVTDGIFDYLQYWVDAYLRQGLRNHLEDMRITHSTIAKVTRDKYYDAVTVRIWATGKDYVVREDTGDLVRGSKRRERPYSEYWTLVRSAARKGAPTTTAQCSNCGAPLEVTQSGECKYCNAHVSAGEFDWVLSKIEQDDSYRG